MVESSSGVGGVWTIGVDGEGVTIGDRSGGAGGYECTARSTVHVR